MQESESIAEDPEAGPKLKTSGGDVFFMEATQARHRTVRACHCNEVLLTAAAAVQLCGNYLTGVCHAVNGAEMPYKNTGAVVVDQDTGYQGGDFGIEALIFDTGDESTLSLAEIKAALPSRATKVGAARPS